MLYNNIHSKLRLA